MALPPPFQLWVSFPSSSVAVSSSYPQAASQACGCSSSSSFSFRSQKLQEIKVLPPPQVRRRVKGQVALLCKMEVVVEDGRELVTHPSSIMEFLAQKKGMIRLKRWPISQNIRKYNRGYLYYSKNNWANRNS